MTHHSSGDFSNNPSYSELLSPTIIELADQPGIATELAVHIDDAVTRWTEHADNEGWIQLGTFNGENVDIRRSQLADGKLSVGTVASGGLRSWLRGRFSSNAGSLHYDIRMPEDEGKTELSLLKLTGSSDSTHLSGERTIESGKTSETIHLYTGINLEDSAQRATDLIQNGFPLSAEAAIAARQAKPCETITGNEAVTVQKVVESFLTDTGATNLGNKESKEQLVTYEAIEPRITGQWSVKRLTSIMRAGTVMPNTPGADGRSVLTFLNFSTETLNTIDGEPITDPLVVCVEGVYKPGTNRLTTAEVRYYTESRHGRKQSLEVSPEGRQEIHTAIASQVNPLYFV